MTIYGRILARLNSIERQYGDVALAATMVCFAIAVHGALIVVPFHKPMEAVAAGTESDIVAQAGRVLLDDAHLPASASAQAPAQASEARAPAALAVSGPFPQQAHRLEAAATQRQMTRHRAAERPATSAASAAVAASPAHSTQVADSPTQSAQASSPSQPKSLHSPVPADPADGNVDKPTISAVASNDDGGSAPLTITALVGDEATASSEPNPLPRQGISAVAK